MGKATRLTDRDAILATIDEYDSLGRDEFLAKYGYGKANTYNLWHAGKGYDPKAIVGVAYGQQFPDEGPLSHVELSGGSEVNGILDRLGFEVINIADRAKDAAPASLEALWEEFRADPIEQLRVRVRREHSRAIVDLFRNHALRNVDDFVREVWRFEAETIIDGDDTWKGWLFADGKLTEEYATLVGEALDDGTAELHGNYIWHDVTGFYVQTGSTDAKRKQAVLDIEAAMNNEALSPQQLVTTLQDVDGVGIGAATGLAMMKHPGVVALFNSASRAFAKELGSPVKNFAEYQVLAKDLKDRLGAEDFFELDWFLFSMNRQGRLGGLEGGPRRYFWVNQNRTFQHEIDGGYMWSPHTNKNGAKNQFYDNMLRVRPGDQILSFAGSKLCMLGTATSKAYDAERPKEFGDPKLWLKEGHKVDVDYEPIANPIRPKDHMGVIRPLLPKKYAPLDQDGNGLQSVYLAELPEPLAMELFRLLGIRNAPPPEAKPMHHLNTIFYGPPGTGKTYGTAKRALEIIDGKAPADRAELMERYRQLRDAGQIDLVTFHQSMSYEEFVEGIRPIVETREEGSDDGGTIRYACVPGIFRNICTLAQTKRGTAKGTSSLDFESMRAWKMSLGNTQVTEEDSLFSECIKEERIAMDYGGQVDFTGAKTKEDIAARLREHRDGEEPLPFAVTAMHALKHKMSVGDMVIVSDGNRKYRAIGRISGDYKFLPGREEYCQTRGVEWLYVPDESEPRELAVVHDFSQQTIYELKKSKLKLDNIKETLSASSPSGETKPHVLIIDEINRGNIAKILGELMTLLEPDKRLGARNGLTVTLPYSKEEFGVPQNLYVLGTMNTADRSIALLDTALRRRFRFEEMMPDASVLEAHVEAHPGLADARMPELLELLNRRIECLFDRDHTLGHAFFLKVTTLEELRDLFVWELIPLLQEYFYEDWTKIAMVLGSSLSGTGEAATSDILTGETLKGSDLFGNDSSFGEDPTRITVNPAFRDAAGPAILPFLEGIFAEEN